MIQNRFWRVQKNVDSQRFVDSHCSSSWYIAQQSSDAESEPPLTPPLPPKHPICHRGQRGLRILPRGLRSQKKLWPRLMIPNHRNCSQCLTAIFLLDTFLLWTGLSQKLCVCRQQLPSKNHELNCARCAIIQDNNHT